MSEEKITQLPTGEEANVEKTETPNNGDFSVSAKDTAVTEAAETPAEVAAEVTETPAEVAAEVTVEETEEAAGEAAATEDNDNDSGESSLEEDVAEPAAAPDVEDAPAAEPFVFASVAEEKPAETQPVAPAEIEVDEDDVQDTEYAAELAEVERERQERVKQKQERDKAKAEERQEQHRKRLEKLRKKKELSGAKSSAVSASGAKDKPKTAKDEKKAAVKDEKAAKKRAKKKDKKPNKIARWFKDVFLELKKVTWPKFGKVVKQTGVVLAVTVAFLLVLLVIDILLNPFNNWLLNGTWEWFADKSGDTLGTVSRFLGL